MANYMVWWTEAFIGEDKPTIEKDLLIITVCNKERHRSVASKELILQSLKLCKQEIRCEVIRVGGEMPHWSKLCPNTCPDCSWDGKERKDLIEKAVETFGDRFATALKDRSLKRSDYSLAEPTTPIEIPREVSPELFPEESIEEVPPRVLKQELKFDKEYLEFFDFRIAARKGTASGDDRDEFKEFLEGMKGKELQVFVTAIAAMFGPDDDIGPNREDKLLKIIQFVKSYNLTFEMMQRWYTNVFKVDKAVRDVKGWKDVTVAVPREEPKIPSKASAPSKAQPPLKSSSSKAKEEPKEKRGRDEAKQKPDDRKRSRSPKRVGLIAREKAHEDKMLWRKEHPTRDEWKDLDPRELPDEALDKLFENRKKATNFIAYVGGDEADRKERKVRVNGKFKPWDDKVASPPDMDQYKKTTMVLYEDETQWTVVAERVPKDDVLQVKDLEKPVDRMCVFLQEPLMDQKEVAFMASERIFDYELDMDHVATMGSKQRKKANEGIDNINAMDDAVYVGLKAMLRFLRAVNLGFSKSDFWSKQ
jgi:hypothetical protein